MTYTAPLKDMRFVLRHLAGLPGLLSLPAFRDYDMETLDAVLEEAAKLAQDVIAPLNAVGDKAGARAENGVVRMPEGFKAAYDAFSAGGWNGVPFPTDLGGGGLPWTMAIATQEMVTSANMAFSLCPLLNQGAVEMLLAHGSEDQKAMYLPKMIAGEWTGTMNLTEPQAGSDVGALKTRAEPAGDGTWRIKGTKIFITYGEHDMADNIIHLVLARTPNAPEGTKGISCFIVPKFLVNPDGSLGRRNDLRVVSTEHKLGIHASPTCVMSYGDNEGAVGYLIGEENKGMRYMFTMMNNARLSVGLQGLAIAERAYQQALAYAQDRRQGRPAGHGADAPIIHHADVKRMLMLMKSQIEAMRALIYVNAATLDRGHNEVDEGARLRASQRTDLLIPLSKAWATDLGCELTSLAVQVFGGMGFVEETGVAQHYRDARIAPIYEGTNGIQALDLIGRKLPMEGGKVAGAFIAEMKDAVGDLAKSNNPDIEAIAARLQPAVNDLARATNWMLDQLSKDFNKAAAGATPYLRLFASVAGGYYLARGAAIAADERAAGHDAAFHQAKIKTARFYADQVLTQSGGLALAATQAAESLAALDHTALVA